MDSVRVDCKEIKMIEVVFNNSVSVALRIAKNYNKDNELNGAIGYIGKAPTKDELEKIFKGQAIAGDSPRPNSQE